MRGVLDLEPFALCLRQALVVGDLFNQTPDFGAKTGLKFFAGGLRIFNRVVEYGSLQRGEIGNAADATENRCNFDGVIDERASLPALAPLVTVFVSSEVRGREEGGEIGVSLWYACFLRRISH